MKKIQTICGIHQAKKSKGIHALFAISLLCLVMFLYSSVVSSKESKTSDIFLIKNSNEFSVCMNKYFGTLSKMLVCSSDSIQKLDQDLLRVIVSNKLEEEEKRRFFKNRKDLCLNSSNYHDGTNQELVYADCLRIRTIEKIIKESHHIENIDDFLLELMLKNKVSAIERENFFNNRKSFCVDAAKFRSEYSGNIGSGDDFYKDCLVVRAVEESLRRLADVSGTVPDTSTVNNNLTLQGAAVGVGLFNAISNVQNWDHLSDLGKLSASKGYQTHQLPPIQSTNLLRGGV